MKKIKFKYFNKISLSIIIMFIIIISLNKIVKKSYAEELNYIYFDLANGAIKFTDSTYSGKDKDGNTVSGSHDEINRYVISQTNSSTEATTNAITVGTSSTAVTKNFIIELQE